MSSDEPNTHQDALHLILGVLKRYEYLLIYLAIVATAVLVALLITEWR